MSHNKIGIRPTGMSSVMHNIAEGRYRIPQFQRQFVWPRNRTIGLFDSIYHDFPIGSIFLWCADRKYASLFRNAEELGIPPPRATDELSFILDGQQRLTSLYATLYGKTIRGTDYSKICFDLDKKEFTYRRLDSDRYVSVARIWRNDYFELMRSLEPERARSLQDLYTKLQTYPMSLVELRDKELSEVCDVFQRINQRGKPLDRFDLVVASTYTETFDLRKRFEEDVNKPLQRAGFGTIYPTGITQLLALMDSGSCTEGNEFKLTAEKIQALWPEAVRAIREAADLLRKNFGAISESYLPYLAQLTLLAYYLSKKRLSASGSAEYEWISRWFWRSTFSQRYGSATATTMSNDAQLFDALASTGRAEEVEMPGLTDTALLRTRMTSAASAIRNGFLCLLAVQPPRDLATGRTLDLSQIAISEISDKQKHHVFPVAHLRKLGMADDMVNRLPNFCFLTGELNRMISASAPAIYLEDLNRKNHDFRQSLESSLLPDLEAMRDLYQDYEAFLRRRASALIDEIDRRCGGLARPKPSDRFVKVEDLERRMRDLIRQTLSASVGPRWWVERVPSDVRENVAKILVRRPGGLDAAQADERRLIECLNFGEYGKILLNANNWPVFKDTFESKDKLQHYLGVLTQYRNLVAHSANIEPVLEFEASAAMEWLRSKVKPDDAPDDEDDDQDDTGRRRSPSLDEPLSKRMIALALERDSRLEPILCRGYIGFEKEGKRYGFMRLAPRQGWLRVGLRIPAAGINNVETKGFEVVGYREKTGRLFVRIDDHMLSEKLPEIRSLLAAAYENEMTRKWQNRGTEHDDRHSKYRPLGAHLSSVAPDRREITLSFAQLEEILGSALPNSAKSHQAFWANQKDLHARPWAAAWQNAGFHVAAHQLGDDGWVRFERV